MLEFKVIETDDKTWADSLLKLSDFRGAEYCFTNLFIWDGIYKSKSADTKIFCFSEQEKRMIIIICTRREEVTPER